MIYYSKIISYHIITEDICFTFILKVGVLPFINIVSFFYLKIDPVQSKTITVIPEKLGSLLGVLSLTSNGRLKMIIFEFKIPDEFRERGKLQRLKAQKKTSHGSVERRPSHLASRSPSCCCCPRIVPMCTVWVIAVTRIQQCWRRGGACLQPWFRCARGTEMLTHLLEILLFKIQII